MVFLFSLEMILIETTPSKIIKIFDHLILKNSIFDLYKNSTISIKSIVKADFPISPCFCWEESQEKKDEKRCWSDNSFVVTTRNRMKYQQIIQIISIYFPIVKKIRVKLKPPGKFSTLTVACCVADVDDVDWTYISPEVRTKSITAHSIHLRNDLPNELLTFLHELAHIITPYVEVKKKNVWTNEPHSILFHNNFLEIIRIINNSNIKYSGIINVSSIEELKRIDRL